MSTAHMRYQAVALERPDGRWGFEAVITVTIGERSEEYSLVGSGFPTRAEALECAKAEFAEVKKIFAESCGQPVESAVEVDMKRGGDA